MRIASVLLVAALALAGCKAHRSTTAIDAADNTLAEGVATPEGKALKAAIHVDPRRAKAGTAAAVAPAAGGRTCIERFGDALATSNDWARKLPAGFALPAGARVTEAAGRDGAPCAIRVVSLAMPGTDRDAARAAGYDAGRTTRGTDLVVAGTQGDAAYMAMIGTPKGGSTPVDWVWSKGS